MAVTWNKLSVPLLLSLLFLLPILLTVCEGMPEKRDYDNAPPEKRDYQHNQSDKRSVLKKEKRDYEEAPTEKRGYEEDPKEKRDHKHNQSEKRNDDLPTINKRSTLVYDLIIETANATRFTTTKWYVSTATAPTIFHRDHYDDFAVEKNRKYFNMARALSPAVVRVGGIDAGWLVFKDHLGRTVTDDNLLAYKQTFGQEYFGPEEHGWKHFNVTEDEWVRIHKWFLDVGWQMNFNLNYLNMKPDTFKIEFTNVGRLLRFVKSQKLPIYGFQLPNEPNSYGFKFDGEYVRTPEQLIEDWDALKRLQNYEGYEFFNETVRIGPDCTSLSRFPSSFKFLEAFFKAGGGAHQEVLGLHHYYFSGKTATSADFINPEHLDKFGETVRLGRDMLDRYGFTNTPLHMSETSNAFGGGSKDFSPAFVASLLYLDQLGLGALYGADVINRYTFFSHLYSITGYKNFARPDYWVAIMHKKLIAGPVLVANTTQTQNRVRLYASCVRDDYELTKDVKVDKGGLVFYWSNLNNAQVTLRLPEKYHNKTLRIWQFTADPTLSTEEAFKSQNMFLNKKLLEFNQDVLPKLNTTDVDNKKSITLDPYSIGFVLIPWANAEDCVNRHERIRTDRQVLGRDPPFWVRKKYSPTKFELVPDDHPL